MQIVINIDDEDYDDITLTGENTINLGVLLDLREAVRKGTPLPKGHGRLIDADKAKENMMYEMCGTGYQTRAMNVLNEYNVPTIIEADEVKS